MNATTHRRSSPATWPREYVLWVVRLLCGKPHNWRTTPLRFRAVESETGAILGRAEAREVLERLNTFALSSDLQLWAVAVELTISRPGGLIAGQIYRTKAGRIHS